VKKKIEWHIIMGDGTPLWDEDGYCTTREAAREYIKDIKKAIFEPWNAQVKLPLTILRREWAVVDERKA
jgi:hypothetical protein